MKVALGQGHGGVEADDGKQPRHVQDGLDHLLAHRRIQVVELRGVVPGKAGAVVAVIDVAGLAAGAVAAAEDHGGVGLLKVVVFNLDLHAPVVGEIGTVEAVGGIGRLWPGDEPLRVLDHPGRIDAHVVGHHVAGQANAMPVSAVAQIDVGRLAAQVLGNGVVEERIGRGHGVRLPQSCLMVLEARLRSQTPISQSELRPRRARVASSSSGISSRRAMLRPYCLLSCASHT